MVTWDGTVKILSFGISSTGYVAAQASGVPPSVLYYMSPEQVGGEKLDARSNLFTWGAMLYEMVTDQKAFDGADADVVRQKILEEMPVSPAILNPKINPVASDVIMKALAKNPAERYQSGREMVNDLEKARESTVKPAKRAPEAPKGPAVPASVKNAAAAKFATSAHIEPKAPPKFEHKIEESRPLDGSPSLSQELETSWTPSAPAKATSRPAEPPKKAAAAAAGWNSGGSSPAGRTPHLDPSAQFGTSVTKASVDAFDNPSANLSAATLDEPQTPKIAVDPMMAENAGAATKGVSFSEMNELPPLKEVYVPPPAPKSESPEADEPLPSIILRQTEPEKPKIQPREVAEKALKEIKSIPPQLLMYSLSAAVALILIVGTAVYWRSRSENTDEEGRVPAPVAAPVTPAAAAQPAPSEPPAPEPMQAVSQAEATAEPVVEEPRSGKFAPAAKGKFAKNKKNSAPAKVAAIPGQLAVDSTPEGAQLEIDGRTDPNWVTPYTLAGLPPGQHTVTVSKSGFASDTRSVDVVSANKATLVVRLTSLNATMNVTSDPPGAAIYVDGKDTARVTPSVISLEKGTHTVLVRKAGYLDETTSAVGQPGQAFHFASTLRPLGNVDDIKTVGKFKKLFGGGGAEAGMGKVSIKTSPKGAQIAINRRILEKTSPVNFLLNPGNYIVDITLSGYKPVQKVITVDQGGNVVIDETLQTP
jgi:serine/threonine-protein kinase